MRVLTVIETLGSGGAERALVALLPALVARGHHCEVAVLRPPFTIGTELREACIPVHDLHLRHRWDVPRGVAGVRSVARGGHFDVLHGHLFFAGLYVASARRLVPGTVGVVTFHNLGYDSFPADTAWRRARKRVDARAMGSVDRLLAVSEAVADHYRANLLPGPIDVVPNGIDLGAVTGARAGREEVLKGLGLDPARPVLVAVGRFVPEKAYGDLVTTMQILGARGCRAQLVVLGEGPGRGEVERAVGAAGIGSYVVLAGARPHPEVLDVVAAADVFVSSSTHEGFPLAPAEAMALGRPLAVTAVGGVPELVGDRAGILVPPGRPNTLADAIIDLLRDPAAAASRGQAGRRRVAESFSVETMAERVEGVYEAALAARRRS